MVLATPPPLPHPPCPVAVAANAVAADDHFFFYVLLVDWAACCQTGLAPKVYLVPKAR